MAVCGLPTADASSECLLALCWRLRHATPATTSRAAPARPPSAAGSTMSLPVLGLGPAGTEGAYFRGVGLLVAPSDAPLTLAEHVVPLKSGLQTQMLLTVSTLAVPFEAHATHSESPVALPVTRPARHVTQLFCPVALWLLPTAQGSHMALPEEGCDEPARHSLQLSARSSEKVPSLQAVGLSLPAGQNEPAGQAVIVFLSPE